MEKYDKDKKYLWVGPGVAKINKTHSLEPMTLIKVSKDISKEKRVSIITRGLKIGKVKEATETGAPKQDKKADPEIGLEDLKKAFMQLKSAFDKSQVKNEEMRDKIGIMEIDMQDLKKENEDLKKELLLAGGKRNDSA